MTHLYPERENRERELLSCNGRPSNQRTMGWNYNKTFNSVSALQQLGVTSCHDHVCHATAIVAIYIPYLVHGCYQNIVLEFSWPQGKYIEKHKTCTAKWFSILNSWPDKKFAILYMSWSNTRYPLFTFSYTIGLSWISCQISIDLLGQHKNLRFLDLYFQEIMAANNFSCSESWLRTWEITSFSQTQVKIIRVTTISVQNCMNIRVEVFVILYVNCNYTKLLLMIISNCVTFLRKWHLFSQILTQHLEQEILIAAIKFRK